MFAIFRKLGWFFKMRWKTYSLAIGGLIACAILSAMIPLIIGSLVDQMAQGTITWDGLIQQTGFLQRKAMLRAKAPPFARWCIFS